MEAKGMTYKNKLILLLPLATILYFLGYKCRSTKLTEDVILGILNKSRQIP